MSYIAIKNFSVNEKEFKIGDPIPTMFVEDRLIRGKKIALDPSINSVETKEEVITEVVDIVEVQETEQELLIEDSSDVEVKIEEVQETPVETKQTKRTKK